MPTGYHSSLWPKLIKVVIVKYVICYDSRLAPTLGCVSHRITTAAPASAAGSSSSKRSSSCSSSSSRRLHTLWCRQQQRERGGGRDLCAYLITHVCYPNPLFLVVYIWIMYMCKVASSQKLFEFRAIVLMQQQQQQQQ